MFYIFMIFLTNDIFLNEHFKKRLSQTKEKLESQKNSF